MHFGTEEPRNRGTALSPQALPSNYERLLLFYFIRIFSRFHSYLRCVSFVSLAPFIRMF